MSDIRERTVLLCGACGKLEPVGYDGTCCTWPMMLVSVTDPRVVALLWLSDEGTS